MNIVFGHKAKRQWSFGNFEHEYVGCKESTIQTTIKNELQYLIFNKWEGLKTLEEKSYPLRMFHLR